MALVTLFIVPFHPLEMHKMKEGRKVSIVLVMVVVANGLNITLQATELSNLNSGLESLNQRNQDLLSMYSIKVCSVQ